MVVINCGEVAMPGVEWEKRVYFHHTGYAKGASWTLAWELHQKDPTMVIIMLYFKFYVCHQLEKQNATVSKMY